MRAIRRRAGHFEERSQADSRFPRLRAIRGGEGDFLHGAAIGLRITAL